MTNEEIKKECYEIKNTQWHSKETLVMLLLVHAVVNVSEALEQMNKLTKAGLSQDQAIYDLHPEKLYKGA